MLGHLLDPFSEEAKRIVQEAPPIGDLPEGAFRLAREKLLWKQREKRPPRSLLTAEGKEDIDILSFHLLYQSAGLFPPHSKEVRLVKEVTHQILKFRLEDLGAQMDPLRILGLLENRLSIEEMSDEGATYRLGDLVVEKREVYGESLGCGVTVELATRREVGGIILESAFTSVVDMGKTILPFLPVDLIVRFRYDSIAKIGKVDAPLLVMHSPQDDIVPYAMGRRLFEAAPEPKTFFEMRGDHNGGFLDTGPAYGRAIKDFLEAGGPAGGK